MELISSLSLGLIIGIFSGILPGIGTATSLILVFPWLLLLEPINLIIFYITLLLSSQYFGSVVAILSGVPGDQSSIPAAKFGLPISLSGKSAELLFLTSKYSFFAGIFSFFTISILIFYKLFWFQSFTVIFQLGMVLFVLVILTIFSQNRLFVNSLLIFLGLFIGFVGYSFNYQREFFTFGWSWLSNGIPWMPIFVGLFVIPNLVKYLFDSNREIEQSEKIDVEKPSCFMASFGRGTVLGFILGLIPGLSYILSSIISAKVEEKISKNNWNIVVSSESANNSGAISMLLPLFLIGLPITVSETIIFNIISNNSTESFYEIFTENYIVILVSFVFVNMVLMYSSYKWASKLSYFSEKNKNIIFFIALFMSISSMIYVSLENNELLIYIVIFLLSLFVGLIYRKLDWTPLVYALLIQSFVESNIFKFQQLYF